jgi:deoxyribodipyrimidine photo-lyase
MKNANQNALPKALVWHRRDLRIDDNTALQECLNNGHEPIGVFIFDSHILDLLPKTDPRIDFIQASVEQLRASYNKMGLDFICLHGAPEDVLPALSDKIRARVVYTNRDYEPYAKERDTILAEKLDLLNGKLVTTKDHVIFESHEILTLSNTNFMVFTPYKNAWLKRFSEQPPSLNPTKANIKKLNLSPKTTSPTPSLLELGFTESNLSSLGILVGEQGGIKSAKNFAQQVDSYATTRDFPHLDSTSRLGIHLRFGTVSIRRLALWAYAIGSEGSKIWLSELIWREFYSSLLDRTPRLAHGESYQVKYDALIWSNEPKKLAAWQQGLTGYPIVDAGMRELKHTGHMHNRVRMIVASFLAKHLDCDWRLGEAHFARHLLDYDLASNNGGWQWSASTGCDAQPYFRIFNPYAQSERFDPQGLYIKKWVPELASCPVKHIHQPNEAKPEILAQSNITIGLTYPAPIVEHASARLAALAKYASA